MREGYQVSQAANGIEALEKARELRPDLIVLDLMLPELGGLEVCRILRQETTTPVLVLSARDSELDKIVGLRVGADDYMTKPFSLAELTARVMALLRRAQPPVEERGVVEVEEFGDFRFDRGARSVRVGDEDAAPLAEGVRPPLVPARQPRPGALARAADPARVGTEVLR